MTMTMVPMMSLMRHDYGKQQLEKGSAFDARHCDVTLLEALGRAKEAKDASKNDNAHATRQSVAKAMEAKPITAAKKSVTAAAKKKPARGKYNRRDMRAKD